MQNKPIIGRYARILLDDWFKRSFGQENSKRLLQLFLEALIPEHRIVELTSRKSSSCCLNRLKLLHLHPKNELSTRTT